ncbi:hypothetical protein C8J56DRAFT_900224 [Mycena floridula]|nr:hypothetical protein C8J56DRAFT_900224 [Mycena floridula]
MSRYYFDAAPVTATVDGANPFSLHRTSRATVLFGLVKGPGVGKDYVVECSALGGASVAGPAARRPSSLSAMSDFSVVLELLNMLPNEFTGEIIALCDKRI